MTRWDVAVLCTFICAEGALALAQGEAPPQGGVAPSTEITLDERQVQLDSEIDERAREEMRHLLERARVEPLELEALNRQPAIVGPATETPVGDSVSLYVEPVESASEADATSNITDKTR